MTFEAEFAPPIGKITFRVWRCKNRKHGDYTTDVAFKIAKAMPNEGIKEVQPNDSVG